MAERLADANTDGGNLSNSAVRAETIRDAVQWLAEKEAEVKAVQAEMVKYRSAVVRGDLGMKIADWNAIYRISQLSAEDRDVFLDTMQEGFAALGIHGRLADDAVVAAGAMPAQPAAPNAEARAAGRQDGLAGVIDHAARYSQGSTRHGDYMLGRADGEAERERALSMGNGAAGAEVHQLGDPPAPRRGRPRGSRNRPKPQDEPGRGGLDPAV